MKVHILQHVPFEGVGSMASWLDAHETDVTCTRFFKDDVLPRLRDLDLVIILGGPMSVNDESTLSWLRPEKQFIRDAVEQKIPLLGVCLGSQLIASALGGRVYQNAHREIGWFPIEATTHPAEDNFRFPERCLVFHWHGETFDLPSGAVRLARSEGCKNKAFQIGKHVIGLQFHIETTPESVRTLVGNCCGDLVPGPYVQTEGEMQQVAPAAYTQINAIMGDLLSYLTATNT